MHYPDQTAHLRDCILLWLIRDVHANPAAPYDDPNDVRGAIGRTV